MRDGQSPFMLFSGFMIGHLGLVILCIWVAMAWSLLPLTPGRAALIIVTGMSVLLVFTLVPYVLAAVPWALRWFYPEDWPRWRRAWVVTLWALPVGFIIWPPPVNLLAVPLVLNAVGLTYGAPPVKRARPSP